MPTDSGTYIHITACSPQVAHTTRERERERPPARPRILRQQWRYNSLLTIAHMPLIPQSSRHYHSQACSSLTFVPAAPQPCPGFAVPCPISYIPTATTSYSAQCSSSRHGCCCCWLEGAVVNFSKALKPIHTLLPLPL